MAKKTSGSAKRYGARYGARLREKTATAEDYKSKKKCPYCNTLHLKRVSVGIWACRKCNAKFAGRAYSPERTQVTEEEV
jgi:large subunit ribosomal protein L37Ae